MGMKRRDYYTIIAIITCFSLLGVLAGYIIFGPIYTTNAISLGPEQGQEYLQYNISTASFDEGLTPVQIMKYAATSEPEPEPISAPSPRYIVSSQDGYIVVHYVTPEGKADVQLNRLTSIFVSSLPQEEQERLAAGIPIYTEDALFRILEDYGS